MKIIKLHTSPYNLINSFKNEGTLNVGLVQINNSFAGQNYLPYTSACLRSYIECHAVNPKRYSFLPFIYKRLSIKTIVQNLINADVVGFSTSVWNANISLEVAKRLKQIKPSIVIIFGGPQVPDKPEEFLRLNTFVDLVVHNEGERTFLSILEQLPGNTWENINGISYISKSGAIIKTPPVERMRDLEHLPSPFLNGIFDELIIQNPNEKWIGLWETNRGCPFQCTFCDWGSATAGKVNKFLTERLFLELNWFAKNKIEYIFVCDANFGSLKRDIEIAEYVSELRKKTGYPHGFSVQSTKNATERAYITQKILADAGLNKGVALSMQSLHPETLRNIKRDNISLDTYLELARRFTRDGIETYSDLIIGLPGETYTSFVEGVEVLINSGQHHRIQFNNLTILPNAEMGDPNYLERFKMKTVSSEIINIHGSKIFLEDDVAEVQDVVIETYSMNSREWVQTRAICWLISFLYFDKLVQIPIILMKEYIGLNYKKIFESFLNLDKLKYPILNEIWNFFISEAESIKRGGVEYKYSEDWLGVYWPADEYVFIKLTSEKKVESFYKEVEKLFLDLCILESKKGLSPTISQSVEMNRLLISQPFVKDDVDVFSDYNIIDYWQGIISGNPVSLKTGSYQHRISRSKRYYLDFQQWCKEIVWWGNKKGAYLYSIEKSDIVSNMSIEPKLSGHY